MCVCVYVPVAGRHPIVGSSLFCLAHGAYSVRLSNWLGGVYVCIYIYIGIYTYNTPEMISQQSTHRHAFSLSGGSFDVIPKRLNI